MKESNGKMERPGRRAKAGSLSGLSGGLPSSAAGVRRQHSLEWGGDRYSSSDDDRPAKPPQIADRVFASLLAQATQQFDDEQRRIYGSESAEDPPRYISSPQRQASPFPLESTNRRFYRRNRNSKGEEIFSAEGGTLSRRGRRPEEFDSNGRGARICNMNGPTGGQSSERECDSPPEPAPPEVPPRGPSLHVTLRHRPCDPPTDSDRLFLSEEDNDDLGDDVEVERLRAGVEVASLQSYNEVHAMERPLHESRRRELPSVRTVPEGYQSLWSSIQEMVLPSPSTSQECYDCNIHFLN